MASRTPPLQPRAQFQRDWGNFLDGGQTTPASGSLPNQPANALFASDFVLEVGDKAYATSVDVGAYVCIDAGSAGGGDAVWVPLATGPQQFCGAVNASSTDPSATTYVVGGLVFDPTRFASPPTFRFLGVLAGVSPTNAELTLVDVGAPGSPAAGVVRSTATIPGATINVPVTVDVPLTVSSAPGVNADEIFDEERMYELRIALDGAAGDEAIVRWGGLVVS